MSNDIRKMIESIVSGNLTEAELSISAHIKSATQALVTERKGMSRAEALTHDTSFYADECEKTGKWCVIGATTGFEYDKVGTEKAAERMCDDMAAKAKAKGRHVKPVAEGEEVKKKGWYAVEKGSKNIRLGPFKSEEDVENDDDFDPRRQNIKFGGEGADGYFVKCDQE